LADAKFYQLANKLRVEIDANPVIVLGPAEQGKGQIFATRDWQVIQNPELGTVAAIARMAQCFVGNDSGLSILAGAGGRRGAVLFGP